ncbi:MAG: MMPL family transporter [Thiotrichales bacterium]|nr:MMPL family transporter [Thiotrichales bacterium]
MINRFSGFYRNTVLTSPVVVLIFLGVIFVFFAWHTQNFRLDASADSLLLENDRDLQEFRKINRRYESNEFVFVSFTPAGDLFSDESLAILKQLRDDLGELEHIESWVSLLDVPLVKVIEGSITDVAENYRTLDSPEIDRDKAKQELMESPLYSDLLISTDGTTTAVLLYLENNEEYREILTQRNELLVQKYEGDFDATRKQRLDQVNLRYEELKTAVDRANHETIAAIRAVMDNYRQYGTLYLGGVPMIADDMITFIRNDLVIFGIGVFVFLIIMLTIIFRQVRWVSLPLISCAFSGLLMMGLLGLVGWRVTVISSNFISLMLILTMSMNVHLIVRYRQLRRDHPDSSQIDLVHMTMGKMVWPCLYTALTTMMGFGSLVVSEIKPVIDFGWMMTIGLSVTFLTSFLLFPSILMLLGKLERHEHVSEEVSFTRALANVTLIHGNKVIFISIILGLLTVIGITRLKVENSFINYFSDKTEIYQGLKLIDEKLGGTTPLDVIIRFDTYVEEMPDEEDDEFAALFGDIETDPADYWFTNDKIDQIKEVHDYLAGLDAVGKVLSLASVVRVAESLVTAKSFDTFELAILYKRLPEDLKASMLDPYMNIEEDEARITLRIRDSLPDLRRKELIERIEADLEQKIGLQQDEFQLTGLLIMYNNMLQSLFRSQILTLGVVMLGIALMLLVLFRSVKLALIGIIPNILAAGIILGLMGWANIPLDMMTITIAAITIGIAVDNAIHYIYRFREEYENYGDYVRTMQVCHANIGRSVFYTAIIIIVGFSILVLSNFIPTIYFGLLTALAMLIALLAALTLLPKLILLWRPF